MTPYDISIDFEATMLDDFWMNSANLGHSGQDRKITQFDGI